MFGSFFDSSPLGRELTVNLARHLVMGYELQEPPIVRLLNNSVFHFVPFTDDFHMIFDQYSRNSNVCDPMNREEFADRLLSPETNKKKTLFLNMLETYQYDLALTFSAGGFDIQRPHTFNPNSIYEKSAANIPSAIFRETHEECALNSIRIHQTSTLEKITQFLLDSYKLPLYSIQVSCCKIPLEKEIATVWKETIHKVHNFHSLTETGVKGSIRNTQNEPLRNSVVTIVDHGLAKSVTKNMAYFRFILPAGQYELQINNSDTGVQTLPISLSDGQTLDLGNILIKQRPNGNYRMANDQVVGKAEVTAIFGGISGLVLDEQNHPIKGAQVTLIDSKEKISNTSDYMGKFELKGTPFGTVTLKVDAYGHESATRLVSIS